MAALKRPSAALAADSPMLIAIKATALVEPTAALHPDTSSRPERFEYAGWKIAQNAFSTKQNIRPHMRLET